MHEHNVNNDYEYELLIIYAITLHHNLFVPTDKDQGVFDFDWNNEEADLYRFNIQIRYWVYKGTIIMFTFI